MEALLWGQLDGSDGARQRRAMLGHVSPGSPESQNLQGECECVCVCVQVYNLFCFILFYFSCILRDWLILLLGLARLKSARQVSRQEIQVRVDAAVLSPQAENPGRIPVLSSEGQIPSL